MVKITIHSQGERKTLSTPFGNSLRECLIESGFTPYRGKDRLLNCHGMGICGTCKVLVFENGTKVEKRSCQIQCFKPMEIELQ